MKEYFKNWSKFEIILVLTSIISIIMCGIIFKSWIMAVVSSISNILTSMLQAKGRIESQFFSVLDCILYSYVSYTSQYYGEVIFSIFVIFPMAIWGIISWITHKSKKTDTVEVNKIKLKEWVILAIISVVAFIGLYNLLKYFNTSELLVSTFSMIASLLATYLLVRRSKYSFVFFLLNDIILIILWGIPVIAGNLLLIPMIIGPLALFINDAYGSFNWNKLEKEQMN